MQSSILTLRTGERTLITGKTGSGKTRLAEVLLRSRKYVVIFDTKGLISWRGYERYTDFTQLVSSKAPRRIYAPNAYEFYDDKVIDRFFRWVYESRNWTLYVDEVSSISRTNVIPLHYFAILTRGREYGITLVSSTQRPSGIHQSILSESESYFIFSLLMPQDRKKLEQVIPVTQSDIAELRDYRHEFIHATQAKTTGVKHLTFIKRGSGNVSTSTATPSIPAR